MRPGEHSKLEPTVLQSVWDPPIRKAERLRTALGTAKHLEGHLGTEEIKAG